MESKKDPVNISIIVPVYKVEKYLRRCLDSLMAQTYRDYEVILVDDGSPDECGAICDAYAAEHDNILVIHQENRGQAAARNHGMQYASGAYISFVDSDDVVVPGYLEYLWGMMQKYDADLSIGNSWYVFEDKELPAPKSNGKDELLDAEETLIRMNYSNGFGATAWPKLYKRQLILDHPFPEGQIYEDLAILYRIVGDCSRVAVGSRRIYYWIQRPGSTMRSDFSEKHLAGIRAAADQLAYIEQYYPGAVPAAKVRYIGKIIELMDIALVSKNSRESFRMLRDKMLYYREVVSDPNAKNSQRIRLRAARAGYLPAKIVFAAHRKMKMMKYN